MKILCWLAKILIIVGALNWGLIGFFDFDLVSMIFGSVSRFVFCLVGLAGVLAVIGLFRGCGCGCGCCSMRKKK